MSASSSPKPPQNPLLEADAIAVIAAPAKLTVAQPTITIKGDLDRAEFERLNHLPHKPYTVEYELDGKTYEGVHHIMMFHEELGDLKNLAYCHAVGDTVWIQLTPGGEEGRCKATVVKVKKPEHWRDLAEKALLARGNVTRALALANTNDVFDDCP
jgi:hypothetical protein